MNKSLNEAILNIGKVDAILFAIEECYLDFEANAADSEMANRATNAFCALKDAVYATRNSLQALAGDLQATR